MDFEDSKDLEQLTNQAYQKDDFADDEDGSSGVGSESTNNFTEKEMTKVTNKPKFSLGEMSADMSRDPSTMPCLTDMFNIMSCNKTNADVSQVSLVSKIRSPKKLFVQLDELITKSHDDGTEHCEWREKARWIKYEEDVLGEANRWGKAHVASLVFRSLIDLHRVIDTGLICLDMNAESSEQLMEEIVSKLLEFDQISTSNEDAILNALLLRHHHQTGNAGFIKKNKSHDSRLSSGNGKRHSVSMSPAPTRESGLNGKSGLMRKIRSFNHDHDHTDAQSYNFELLKKIPEGAEVATVLAGEMNELAGPCIAFVRLDEGVVFDHLSEVPLPVRFVCLCVGPPDCNMNYIEIGRSLSTLLSNPSFSTAMYAANDRDDIKQAMNEFLDASLVLPPGDFDKSTLLPILNEQRKKYVRSLTEIGGQDRKFNHADGLPEVEAGQEDKSAAAGESGADGDDDDDDDPLIRTGIPFGGLAKDVKRRYSKYWSDIRDGFSLQVLAAIIFIYFAAVSPAITFGGLLADKTDSYIGASELLLGTTISGVIYAVFSGQPLLIPGFTGPLLVFEEGIYKFAKDNGIDYMSWRLWIGVWIFIISLIHLACEASFLIRYVTRFTQEIFAFLIALIFIYETFAKLYKIFQLHPLCWNYEDCLEKTGKTFIYSANTVQFSKMNASFFSNMTNETTTSPVPTTLSPDAFVHPNTALLSMSLTLFTFSLAYYFKQLRNKKILGRTVRRALGDFGVPISILILCLVDILIGDDVFTQKLSVPDRFSVSSPDLRGWVINPLGLDKKLPIGHIFSAAIPALLGVILIFMETLITGMIINKAEHRLQKGTGFHLDILLMGVFAIINGFMGLPFMTCATVRSVSHTSALTVITRNVAPGEQPKLERVIEQRVSNLVVHILIGASMFLGMVLSYIPIAVLFGVFLYMGVASLGGIQLYQRIIMIVTPKKHHPTDVGYVRHVRLWKMHLFTLIQLLCVGILWAVKSTPAALAFPFVLLLIVPFRLFILKYVFSEQELSKLDKDDSDKSTALDKAGQEDEPDFYEQAHMPI